MYRIFPVKEVIHMTYSESMFRLLKLIRHPRLPAEKVEILRRYIKCQLDALTCGIVR